MVAKVFQSPAVIKRCDTLGIVHEYLGPAELGKLLATQVGTIEKVAREVGMQKK